MDRAVLGAVAIGWVGSVLFAFSPHRAEYAASLVAILAFALAPLVFPSIRARLDAPLCPLNWVLVVFLFQLVIDPLLVCWAGPFVNTLPFLPGSLAVNVSLLVSIVAWVAFAAGSEVAARVPPRPHPARLLRAIRRLPRPAIPPNRLALAFGLLGIFGLGLAFHSPRGVIDYFYKAGGHVGLQAALAQGGPVHTVSVILRSFLAFAFIVPWCARIDRRQPGERLIWWTLLTAVLVVLSSATYSYNRASAAAPIVVMAAVYGARVIRIRIAVLVLVAVLGIGVVSAARAYRNNSFTISQMLTSSTARQQVLDQVSLNREIQIYAAAPQYLGFLLETTQYGRHPHYGKTTLSSAMFPLPRLGRPFRPTSGVTVYNHLIYGPNSTITDQVVPFQGELFLDFAFGGVLVAYLGLGLALSRVQRAFDRASTAFAAYAWQYAAVWLGFLVIGSLAVVTQIAFYFFWPVAVFAYLAGPAKGGGER